MHHTVIPYSQTQEKTNHERKSTDHWQQQHRGNLGIVSME